MLVSDGVPNEELAACHAARAEGGAGLIVLEVGAVHETAFFSTHTIQAYRDDCIPDYAKVVRAVHEHGASVFGQLFHPGREVCGLAASGTRPHGPPSASHPEHTGPRAPDPPRYGRKASIPPGLMQTPVSRCSDERRVVGDQIEGDPAILVPRFGIGAAGQKRIDGRRVASPGRRVQRGPAILGPRVGIGAAGQKRIDGLRVASPGRRVQRGPAMLGPCVGIAPPSRSAAMAAAWPLSAAPNSGVAPFLARALGSALPARSAATTAAWPLPAASCSGVWPYLSRALGSAPPSRSAAMAAAWPPHGAAGSGHTWPRVVQRGPRWPWPWPHGAAGSRRHDPRSPPPPEVH